MRSDHKMLQDLRCVNSDCGHPAVCKDVWVKKMEGGEIAMEMSPGVDALSPVCDNCGAKLQIALARFSFSSRAREAGRVTDAGSTEGCGDECKGCVVGDLADLAPLGSERVVTDPRTGQKLSGTVMGYAVGRNLESGEVKAFAVCRGDKSGSTGGGSDLN